MPQRALYIARKNPVSRFFVHLALLLLLIIILDQLIGGLLRYFYFKQESGLQYRTTYSIEKTTADLLVFGASRANHHYHPDVFESRTGLSYYNVGRDGNYIFYHYGVLKGVLKRYTPKVIILDVINFEFKPGEESYDRIASLLPYYKSHPEIREVVQLKGPYERLKLLSAIYPYNSSMFTIAAGNAEFNKTRMGDIKGYVPLTRVWAGAPLVDKSEVSYELDPVKVKTFESFIQDCKAAKTKLYLVCSPYLVTTGHTDHSVKTAKEIARRNGISFYDHSRDTFFLQQPALFADYHHLNDEGAKVFSGMILDEIAASDPFKR